MMKKNTLMHYLQEKKRKSVLSRLKKYLAF